MGQAGFSYGDGDHGEASRRAASVEIFSDRPGVCATLSGDLEAAGLQVISAGQSADLNAADMRARGDMILIDCAECDTAMAGSLAQISEQASRTGAQLAVATSLDFLDTVYAASGADATLLVDPSRSDWMVTVGQMLARVTPAKVREMSDEDRLSLLRLTEQVSQIALKLDRMTEGGGSGSRAFNFESPGSEYRGEDADGSDRLVRSSKPPLPDPRLLRRIIRQRQLRARFFDGDLFADPAWDILLDLTAARVEHLRVSVTSLCIASGVPPTTALRWISQMVDAGLLERVEDETDRRRAFIALTDKAADNMARYFVELGKDAVRTI
ncbi:winged helix DNA-binding protein [Altererythrobacter sp. SALINAS58]|uniref:winged helix DNA-binding protein n=1 Tax=Alteripontixanthobacter muriae TaxID=2705546 RepID=UPI001576BF78|nr:winged helix DNA-binding protein [Alteripontixanthobacter muriae]NTZ42034.1 winged helix DNA-binding protein [Alteripontixanthobacter muriae]